jgi:hypothetical protein
MKKQIGQKIIILMSVIFISAQFIYPITINAEVKLDWDNPNQGKNPYKFKLSDYLNSQMAMQVLGCTGIVNTVSSSLTGLMSGDVSSIKWLWENKKAKINEQICIKSRVALMTGLAGVPYVDPEIAAEKAAEFCHTQKTSNKETEKAMKDELKIEKSNQFREECLNGIAYTLARNQLTAMTKQTMNWVTSGFNGDPMYVRNINNFLSNVEDEIIYQELNAIKNLDGSYNTRDYPYGRDFSTSLINSRQASKNFAESSKQDLTNYLTDGATIDDFANDFSKGGWAGWLGLTQHPQNSPLGYTMIASQNVADKQAKETENVKAENAENNGILSQKTCKVKAITKKQGQIEIENSKNINELNKAQKKHTDLSNQYLAETDPDKRNSLAIEINSAYDDLLSAQQKVKDFDVSVKEMEDSEDCDEWEVVTPGSLIQDKVSSYLNSPERQLEMANDINEVLNVLFAKLIDKLRLDGLSSLNSETFTNSSGGIGSNSWTTPINYTDVEGNKYAGSGLDQSRPFDLTKDLGNIYNHSDVRELGTWDANINETTPNDKTTKKSLLLGVGTANTYYTVTVAGDTKLFLDGYNGWAVGERAFFDGENWQNWKKGENSPIAKKGIIQIQKDYVTLAKELLKVMPGVMPALGELDYCIPGPNPNWQINSEVVSEVFTEFVDGLEVDNEDRANIVSPTEKTNDPLYKNYRAIFANSYLPEVRSWNSWSNVMNSDIISYMDKLAQSIDDGGSEHWLQGESTAQQANDEVSELKQNIFDSLNIFNEEYPSVINKIYGTIQQEYITHENKIIDLKKDKNPTYIPMAKEGLTLTKKMDSYNEEIIQANEDLKDMINETDSIVNKLEIIKNEVSKIIKDAQDRRDGAITEALNKDPYNKGYNTNTAYKTEYAECLNEENITYVEFKMDNDESNRCGDKVDNDFDGLIDEFDPDCIEQRNTSSSNTPGYGAGGSGAYYETANPSANNYSQEANAY